MWKSQVDAIQVCGGQKTVDGKRCRYGGGMLWSVLKAQDPNAYREIMKKGRKRASVHDRMRVPVTDDDLIGEEDPKDKST
ncbi:hypothetical protein LOK49_Contig246G00003 [Camellia lanceoleosa]|nr:hypothetical protein LOK49_Contig246G00003 [Camellia lanceoleosa]